MTKKASEKIDSVILSGDEAALLAICFANYRLAIIDHDREPCAQVNDNVVLSGKALLIAQRITGVNIARPDLIERMIASVRTSALEE